MVRAIAEAMFAEDGEIDGSALDQHVDAVDAFVGAASKTVRVGLRIALLLVRLSPILFFFRLTTLERLGVADRVVLLTRVERSQRTSLSLAFIGWRTMMTLLFYEDPGELQKIGYAGDQERHRYRRALPVLAATNARVAHAAPDTAAPVPLESGVRLRDPATLEGEPAGSDQEVA